MSKALANAGLARLSFEAGHFDGAANRAYYAVVHAQAAALTLSGEDPYRRASRRGSDARFFEKEDIRRRFVGLAGA